MSRSKTSTVTHDSNWTQRGKIDLAKVLAVPAQHIISVSVNGHVQENYSGSNPDGLSIQVQVIQHHETKA